MDWFTFKLILSLIFIAALFSGCVIVGFFMTITDIFNSSQNRDTD